MFPLEKWPSEHLEWVQISVTIFLVFQVIQVIYHWSLPEFNFPCLKFYLIMCLLFRVVLCLAEFPHIFLVYWYIHVVWTVSVQQLSSRLWAVIVKMQTLSRVYAWIFFVIFSLIGNISKRAFLFILQFIRLLERTFHNCWSFIMKMSYFHDNHLCVFTSLNFFLVKSNASHLPTLMLSIHICITVAFGQDFPWCTNPACDLRPGDPQCPGGVGFALEQSFCHFKGCPCGFSEYLRFLYIL